MVNSPYITTREFAELARRSPETVRYWRWKGIGPRSAKRGRVVLYLRSEVEAWLAAAFEDGPEAA